MHTVYHGLRFQTDALFLWAHFVLRTPKSVCRLYNEGKIKRGGIMSKAHVLIAVSGGIAAYKACDVVSRLHKQGYEIKVMMTEHAAEFISPLTLKALCHNDVYTAEFDPANPDPIAHIGLASWADVLCVVPATANVIAKAVHGLADDLVTSCFLACTCPKILCPAMNTHMYENPVTQNNLALARSLGWRIVEPETGLLACLEEGKGRLPKPETIVQAIENALADDPQLSLEDVLPQNPYEAAPVVLEEETAEQSDLPLHGLKVAVSAGPTQEALDPVRYLTNHSSGKQGYAIAQAARDLGAQVSLVSGPVQLDAPEDVYIRYITSARDLEKAMLEEAEDADFIIMAAAVGDYRPETVAEQKIKKTGDTLELKLVRNPDILKELGARKKPGQILCGFAMETENLDRNARQKLESKNCDLLIANNLSTPGAGFQGNTNVVSLLLPETTEHLPVLTKEELGRRILLKMKDLLQEKNQSC